DGDAEHGEARVPAPVGIHHQPADLRRREVLARRRWRSVVQLPAIDDLQYALGAGAVREVHAVAVRDGPVHALGRVAGRARLLAGQAEVTDEPRPRGVAEVVDL